MTTEIEKALKTLIHPDDLIKAGQKDYSKLIKKTIIDKHGHKKTTYVSLDKNVAKREAKETSDLTSEQKKQANSNKPDYPSKIDNLKANQSFESNSGTKWSVDKVEEKFGKKIFTVSVDGKKIKLMAFQIASIMKK